MIQGALYISQGKCGGLFALFNSVAWEVPFSCSTFVRHSSDPVLLGKPDPCPALGA